MRPLKLPPQIIRLVLLTICIVGSYLTARYFLTPSSFREYGWYRGDAIGELASREPVFAGRKSCEECHAQSNKDPVKVLALGKHQGLSCEDCHFPALAHTQNPDNRDLNPKPMSMSACTRCHEANVSRPQWMHQITSRSHYAGQKCTECHLPHKPEDFQ